MHHVVVDSADIFNARVLIVDDQATNVLLLERTLRQAGYLAVESTLDPRTVCELHRKNHYDLILLDLQMSGMDGFEVMAGLTEMQGHGYVSVLVLTAEPDLKLRALQAGAKDFVSKPFDFAEILTRVHDLLEVRLYASELERTVEQLTLTVQENERVRRELLVTAEALRVKADALAEHERELAERLLAEQRLSARLDSANQELDQFAYAASHDLKAPLRGIMNLTGWIEEDLGELASPEVKASLALIHNRAKRLESLVNGMLAYARAGRLFASPEQLDAAVLVKEVIELLAPPANVRFELDALPCLFAERVALQQIFMNLIQNAIKHGCPDGGTIKVSCREEERFFCFSVADTGPGIAAEYHQRVFEMFETLASRDKVEGSGIGLSVVNKLVEIRGGAMTLSSEPGSGATFSFTWPKQPPANKAARAS